MKPSRRFIVVTIAVVFVGAVAAYFQATDNPITVASTLKKAECPLTEKKLTALVAIPNERGSNQRAREIYAEKQNEEMGKIYQNRNR